MRSDSATAEREEEEEEEEEDAVARNTVLWIWALFVELETCVWSGEFIFFVFGSFVALSL